MTFALCAFGQLLVQRHRLAMRLHASLMPEASVWTDQAFALSPADSRQPVGRDIRSAQLEDPRAIPLLERAATIKSLAALLRYAYLADSPVRTVSWCRSSPSDEPAQPSRLRAVFVDGLDLDLRLASEFNGDFLILQGGEPDAWFDQQRWTSLAPLHRPPAAPVPLSEPRRFSARHAQLLRALGARELRRNLWVPPPASAIDDLEGLLAQQTGSASQPRAASLIH